MVNKAAKRRCGINGKKDKWREAKAIQERKHRALLGHLEPVLPFLLTTEN